MEEQLGFLTTDSFAAALKIYENGGNSKSYAKLKVSALAVAANAGDSLVGKTESDGSSYGEAMESAAGGDTELNVLYVVSEEMTNYLNCRVGGLTNPVTEGCKYFNFKSFCQYFFMIFDYLVSNKCDFVFANFCLIRF